MERNDLAQYEMPDEPGIYRFQDGKRILYIGKATSLRDRVRSYFARDLSDTRSAAIAGMVAEANRITWDTTESVLEALILEANLIKKHEPPYNTASKDNKSFNYLIITKETFPRILVTRGRELFADWQEGNIKHVFGPFPQGGSLKDAMTLVRKIFPYRDSKCVPCDEQRAAGKPHCKPCFNRQIGLCPGTCTGEVTAREYGVIVRHIALLFSGKKGALLKDLEKEMQAASKAEKFEEAQRARRQIAALTHIRDVALIKDESRIAAGGAIVGTQLREMRIEAYDIAHTAGTETVGVMVVVRDGEPYKSAYRKFKVRGFTNNDPGALGEVLSRRLLHPEWQYPRIVVVDGSTGQMNAAKRLLSNAGMHIPVVGVVKDEFHRPQKLIGDQASIAKYEREILLANSEAHRFAITYHRKRRGAIF